MVQVCEQEREPRKLRRPRKNTLAKKGMRLKMLLVREENWLRVLIFAHGVLRKSRFAWIETR